MCADFVLYEEEFKHLEEALRRLRQEANAKAVFLIDKNGQQIASAGEVEQFDTTSLASLTAGNVAATDGLAKLIGEREFSVLFHEGQQDHIHISIVAKRAILVVIFDDRSSLGLVRLRVKRACAELEKTFEVMLQKGERGARQPAHREPRFARSPTTTSTPLRRIAAEGGAGRRRPGTWSAASGEPGGAPRSRKGTDDDDFHQLRQQGDQLQDRLLRPRPVWEDDQSAVHLQQDRTRSRRAR